MSKTKTISLTLHSDFEKDIRFKLNQLYRLGYTSISIKSKQKNISLIRSLCDDLFLDVVFQQVNSSSCCLKIDVLCSEKDFFMQQERLFNLISLSFQAIKDSELNTVEDLTKKYRKYDNSCRRYVYNSSLGFSSYDMSSLLVHLLMIQTDLSRLASTLRSQKGDEHIIETVSNFFERLKKLYLERNLLGTSALNKNINEFLDGYMTREPIFEPEHYCFLVLRILYSCLVPITGLLMVEM